MWIRGRHGAAAKRALVTLLVAVVPLVELGGNAEPQVVAVRKPCPAECAKRGQCNYEEGLCECPWGFTGPSCETDRMAACRQTTDDPGSCGYVFPKNCECFRECMRLYCHHGADTHRCASQWGHDIYDSPCWLYGNNVTGTAGRPQNSSEYPESPEDNTVWYTQIPELYGAKDYAPDMLLKDKRRLYKSSWERPDLVWHRAPHTAHALAHCGPSRCSNGRGFCLQYEGTDTPRCECHFGFNGTECEVADNVESCSFSPDCGGHGTCHSGFCHCRDGRWGLACHRSAAVQPAVAGSVPDMRSRTKLKIYMYDLPWEIAFPFEVKENAHGRDPMYTAYEYFLQYFLTDATVRTENPYEANLFYMPALIFFYAENLRPPEYQTEVVVNYIRQKWPFFNRTDGRDHFLFLTGDRGSCHLPRDMQDSMIKVVHFGLQRRNHTWGGFEHNKDYACIQVKRDLVVPPHPNDHKPLWPVGAAQYYKDLTAAAGRDPNRNLTFLFVGGVADGEYSGGTRVAVQKLLMNNTEPDIKFIEGRTDDYVQLLWSSKFCLAAYGHGWGIRLMQALHFGCIPVVVQDHVYQAYEDFMPYEEFAVRMPLRDVPRMLEVLRGFSEEQLAVLRLGLAKYYRAFIWDREYGGQAYEWTLAGLQRRSYNIHAGLVLHRHRRRGG